MSIVCGQIAKTLLPPSEVDRCRTRILRHEIPNFPSLRLITPPWSTTFSTSRMAKGAKSKASPAFRLMIWMSICSSTSLWVLVDVSKEAAARWFLRTCSQSGEVNRWTKVKEQRSRSLGDIVGSWVAMITRQARCLWRRTAVINDSVNFCAAGDSLKNLNHTAC